MEYKPEPYPVSGDLFEIPAAEQEVTVGSNDHNGGFVGGTGGISMYHASQNPGNIIVQSPVGLSLQHHGQTPNKMPRIIMLQRAGQPTGLGISGGQVLGSSGLKAVKIITVPGQGIGGKPIRAAVIPRNMLQRNIKVVTASGIQQNLSMARTVFTGGAGSVPRVLTLRPAGQLVSQGGNISTITPVRTRNLFLANPNAGGFLAHQQRHDELDTGMTADRIGLHAPGLHGPSGAGGYFELAPGPQFVRPCSPNAGGSGDEQDQ
ncbi:unnamed protein product [Protopolystoma xenopodis]|uniref:Uncharacterized protein n=1 Tax=Protopolystoma xenopodis TaxID=117903 RepID=A0A3S5AV51_9PLAT|nr:unnamed protein product [Protopolystoma xenopodis]